MVKNQISTLCVSLLCILTFFFAVRCLGSESHTPNFRVKKVSNTNIIKHEIYDGDFLVCKINELGNFDIAKIVPEKNVQLSSLFTTWNPTVKGVVKWNFEKFNIESKNGRSVLIESKAIDPEGFFTCSSEITLSYDSLCDGYNYDVKMSMTNHKDISGKYHHAYGVRFGQYADLWSYDSFGPALNSNDSIKKKYHDWVVQAREYYFRPDAAPIKAEGYTTVPINRSSSKGSNFRWYVQKDGIWCFLNNNQGNPAVQLLDDTYKYTSLQFCYTGLDVHHFYKFKESFQGNWKKGDDTSFTIPKGYTAKVHYRIFRITSEKSKEITEKMQPLKFPKRLTKRAEDYYPLFLLKNDFNEALTPHWTTTKNLDPWNWIPQHNKNEWDIKQGVYQCTWDKNTGRKDKTSLKIFRTTDGISAWNALAGPGYKHNWEKRKKYFFKAYIKTQEVKGGGAVVRAKFKGRGKEFVCQSEYIKGTKDWTLVEFVTPEPPSLLAGNMELKLILEGSGIAWFDDVEFGPVN
jgi:hypothetical protein